MGAPTRGDQGVALPGVLLLAAFLVSVTGWLLGHVRVEQQMAQAGEHMEVAHRAATAALELAALSLGSVPEWAAVGALIVPLACPPAGAAIVASAPAAETMKLQAETRAGSRWGGNTPQWQLVWQCHAPGVLGRWPSRSPAPSLLVWAADDPEPDGDPLLSTNGRLLIRALAVGANGSRATAGATIQRDAAGAPVILGAWRTERW